MGDITNRRFAVHLARIARQASGWAADSLDYDDPDKVSRPATVQRFIADIEDRLEVLRQEAGLPERRSALQPKDTSDVG